MVRETVVFASSRLSFYLRRFNTKFLRFGFRPQNYHGFLSVFLREGNPGQDNTSRATRQVSFLASATPLLWRGFAEPVTRFPFGVVSAGGAFWRRAVSR